MNSKAIGWTGIGALSCAVFSLVVIISFFTVQSEAILTTFPVQLIGLLLLSISLFASRRWWLLIALPPLLYPLGLWTLLLYSCLQGDCL